MAVAGRGRAIFDLSAFHLCVDAAESLLCLAVWAQRTQSFAAVPKCTMEPTSDRTRIL